MSDRILADEPTYALASSAGSNERPREIVSTETSIPVAYERAVMEHQGTTAAASFEYMLSTPVESTAVPT
jgi:hypothetical protein